MNCSVWSVFHFHFEYDDHFEILDAFEGISQKQKKNAGTKSLRAGVARHTDGGV